MKGSNHERDMYIYHARKDDKRTFVDIGRDVGISPQRVRAIYRRMDWQLNGLNADHHKDATDFPPPLLEVVKDPDTGKYTMVAKGGRV